MVVPPRAFLFARWSRVGSVAVKDAEFVMPGLVPGIHAFLLVKQGVDGRDKPGHDVERSCVRLYANPCLPRNSIVSRMHSSGFSICSKCPVPSTKL